MLYSVPTAFPKAPYAQIPQTDTTNLALLFYYLDPDSYYHACTKTNPAQKEAEHDTPAD